MGESMRGGGVDDGAPDVLADAVADPGPGLDCNVSDAASGGVAGSGADGGVSDAASARGVAAGRGVEEEAVTALDPVAALEPRHPVEPLEPSDPVEPLEPLDRVEDQPLARNRWNVVLAIAGVVLLLGVGGVALHNRSVRDDAAVRRREAAELDRQRDDVAAQLEQDEAERAALIELSDHVDHDLAMLVTAVSNRVVDHDNVIDLEREAIGKANDGDLQASKDLFESRGGPLLDALAEAASFLATQRAQLDADIQHLKESAGA